MKTVKATEKQEQSLHLLIAIMQLDGKITKAEAKHRHNIVRRSALNRFAGRGVY